MILARHRCIVTTSKRLIDRSFKDVHLIPECNFQMDNDINFKISDLSETPSVQNFFSLVREASNKRNFDVDYWNRLATDGCSLVRRMSSKEICETFRIFGNARFRDRKLINVLFASLFANITTYSSKELIIITNSCLQLQTTTRHVLDPLIKAYTNLLESVIESNDSTLYSSPIEIVEMTHILSKAKFYHQRFWHVVGVASSHSMSRLDVPSVIMLLESFARMDIRDSGVLVSITEALLAPQFCNDDTNNGSAICTAIDNMDWSSLIRAVVAFDRLSHSPSDWTVNVDRRIILSGLEDMPKRLISEYLYSVVCLRGQFNTEIVTSCLRRLGNGQSLIYGDRLRPVWEILSATRPDITTIAMTDDIQMTFDQNKHTRSVPRQTFWKSGAWVLEFESYLVEMNIQTESLTIETGGELYRFRHSIPDKQVVLWCLGPFSFYMNKSQLTARTEMLKRLIEIQGYQVVIIPYFHWTALKTKIDKKRYIWQIGRKAAAERCVRTVPE